jgi:hypothetical protein
MFKKIKENPWVNLSMLIYLMVVPMTILLFENISGLIKCMLFPICWIAIYLSYVLVDYNNYVNLRKEGEQRFKSIIAEMDKIYKEHEKVKTN